MKFKFWKFFFWYLVFYYLIDGGIHAWIKRGHMERFEMFDSIFELTSLISFFLFSLLSYLSLYYFYPKKKWLQLAIGILMSFLTPMLFRYGLEQKLFYFIFEHSNYPQHTTLSHYFRDQYIFSTSFIVFGIIYFFWDYSSYSQKTYQELQLANREMELDHLRSQINPHFLLNSLNNIQSLIVSKSDNADLALENLSEILKYSLYGTKTSCRVDEEMKVVRQYIQLQNLRHTNTPSLQIEIAPETQSIEIPQYTLIPLIENIYKHAVLDDADSPCILRVKIKNNKLLIYTSNKIRKTLKDKVGGIGLENLEKRLQLLYPHELTFTKAQTEDNFALTIQFPSK